MVKGHHALVTQDHGKGALAKVMVKGHHELMLH